MVVVVVVVVVVVAMEWTQTQRVSMSKSSQVAFYLSVTIAHSYRNKKTQAYKTQDRREGERGEVFTGP